MHPRQQQKQRMAAQPLFTRISIFFWLEIATESNSLCGSSRHGRGPSHFATSTARTVDRGWGRLQRMQGCGGGIATRLAEGSVVLLGVLLALLGGGLTGVCLDFGG